MNSTTHTNTGTRVPQQIAITLITTLLLQVCMHPITASAASSWSPTLLANTEAFQVIDDADTTADLRLKFGLTLNKSLIYERTAARFKFDDDLYIQGDLSVNGTVSGRTLRVYGTMSGNALFVARSFSGAGLTDCDAGLSNKLLWDSTTGRFSCGTDQTGGAGSSPEVGTLAFTGGVMRIGDARWVKKQGDTMTGALRISINSASAESAAFVINQQTQQTGALIRSTSGLNPALAIDIIGTSAAPHVLFGYQGTFDTNLYRSTANMLKTDDSLTVQGTLSASTLNVSGTSTFNGNLVFGNNLSDAITANASTWNFTNNTTFVMNGGAGTLEVKGTISGSQLRAGNMTLSGSVVYSSGNTLKQTAKGLSGQLLISQGTSAPKWANPVGGMIWYFDGTQAVTAMKGPQITMPFGLTLTGVTLKAKGAPTGAALIYDINKNGSSIFSTRPQIASNSTLGGTGAVFSTTNIGINSVLTIDIDQVGSTFAGSGVTVILKGFRNY